MNFGMMWSKKMRDPNRIPTVLAALNDIWQKVPDWRFGQLMSNFYAYTGKDLFYVEDEQYIKLIKDFEKSLELPE